MASPDAHTVSPGETVELSLFALTVSKLHGWGPRVPSIVPVNLWWGFGLFLGKLLWLKFVVCETDLSSSWKLLGVYHIGANRSFLCGQMNAICRKGALKRKRGSLWSQATTVPGLMALVLRLCRSEGFSQARNDPWNIVWILRLDVSGFSFNKVFRIYIFKVHCFKLKSHLNGGEEWLVGYLKLRSSNKLTNWTDTVDFATELWPGTSELHGDCRGLAGIHSSEF